MANQEAFLASEDLGDSLDGVNALVKKHDDFEKSVHAHSDKVGLQRCLSLSVSPVK